MHQAGVPFLAGTDTPGVPYVFPGFSLHEELALLVAEGGFTPLEALQAATRDSARFLGREKDLGTVEPGKLADLVLLDADPAGRYPQHHEDRGRRRQWAAAAAPGTGPDADGR
jgi:imidazolonepropionase-like amidohydrolase